MTTPLPIQPRPPIRGGLASVAAPLPDGTDWRLGVEVRSSPDTDVFVWNDPCNDQGVLLDDFSPLLDNKPVVDAGPAFRFYPIAVGKIVQCGPGATETTIGDIARQQASGSLDRQVHKALAAALHGKLQAVGQYGSNFENSTSIQTNFVTPDGFDDLNPGNIRGTMQGLLDSVCGCSNSDPVFHIPRAWMPHFIDEIVTWDEATGKFWFGPHEVSFDCYPNELVPYTTNPDGSEVWIYATARPMVAVEEEDVTTVLTRSQNNWSVRVERHAIVAFDATCVYAAKATILP